MKDKLPGLLLLLTSACGPSAITATSSTTTSDATSDEPASTEDSASTDDTGESTHVTFIPDDQPPDPTSCDPFAQDCAEGEKCVPYASDGGSWDANKCVPVNGDQAPGEPCIYAGAREGTDDCDATSLCWYVEEIEGELVGECLPFCLGNPERYECPEGSFCPISAQGTVNVCLPRCDPVAQNCDGGHGCYWANWDFTCAPTLESIPAGEPCGFINDCAPGHLCATEEVMPDCAGSACCSPFCHLELGDEQCASVPGTVCSSFFEVGTAPPGYEHVGVCILP